MSAPKASPSQSRPERASPARRAAATPPSTARETFAKLRKAHPNAHCELNHASPFELVVATVLSAQSTDVAVNQVTPVLFRSWSTPQALAKAAVGAVEAALNRLGMFRQKAKNIIGLARKLCDEHQGEVPRTLGQLVALPGVGRKTANVVLGVAFGAPEGVVVDTHVQRITQRLGWTKNDTPEKIERDLMALFPRRSWDSLSHTLIFHGRRICTARKPACAVCPVSRACPSAFDAEQVGRKSTRASGPIAGARSPAGAKDQPGAGKRRRASKKQSKPLRADPAGRKMR